MHDQVICKLFDFVTISVIMYAVYRIEEEVIGYLK